MVITGATPPSLSAGVHVTGVHKVDCRTRCGDNRLLLRIVNGSPQWRQQEFLLRQLCQPIRAPAWPNVISALITVEPNELGSGIRNPGTQEKAVREVVVSFVIGGARNCLKIRNSSAF